MHADSKRASDRCESKCVNENEDRLCFGINDDAMLLGVGVRIRVQPLGAYADGEHFNWILQGYRADRKHPPP